MMTRQTTTKIILWAIVGVLASVSVARFLNGLGATTGLSDAAPWGFWIAFDVMAGVALAAGGFVLAATVYIFRLERFHQFVRPAVLTAFLGYGAVAVGLMYDLGLPWNIWHPTIFPQPHSVLFEVAMCVMLYLTVLFLEFCPVILEHPWFGRPLFQKMYRFVKKATIPLVITGIVLSTLHQSSLGSLFLIVPHRLHALWYSPIMWVLFFISAVGLGLMMVTLESFFSAWYFGHKLRMDLLSKLGMAASVVLLLYAGIRLTDLIVRGVLGAAFDGSTLAFLFGFELLVSALIPGLLLAIPRVRNSPRGLATAAVMTVFGIIGYRFDVCIVAFARPEAMSYFPTWMEVAVSTGIVAGAMLVFIFFVDNLKVYPEDGEDDSGPASVPEHPVAGTWNLLPESLAGPERYTLALLLGFVAATAALPENAIYGAQPSETPVSRVRIVDEMAQPTAGDVEAMPLMIIDGNRDGRLVLFPHDEHASMFEDEGACATCHHQNMPFRRNSACAECHRDMYSLTDIFSHSIHVTKLDGNQGCALCHPDGAQAKTRETATPCLHCHADMAVEGSKVNPGAGTMTGYAASYTDAMHGLCIGCHEEMVDDATTCTYCHRDGDGRALKSMPPYVSATGSGAGTGRRAK